jgi:hypothetical protein
MLSWSAECFAKRSVTRNVVAGSRAALCAACHGVEAADVDSPLVEAPPFQLIARDPDKSKAALAVFFHPPVPNLIIRPEDARDLIAHIRGLV